MKLTAGIAAVLLALLLLACGGEKEEQASGFPVTLHRVEGLALAERIEAAGELQAKEHAEIAAEVAGRITDVLIDEGALVEAGAEVMAIDPERRTLERDSASARLDEARANLKESRREAQRLRDLFARKVASQTQLDKAETDLKLAESRVVAAEAELGVLERAVRDATVTAPFSGYIARRLVSRGEYVQPGKSLFELVALDPIEVEFNVTEVDSGRVALGQNVDLRLAPFPDETFTAEVTFVSPTVDVRSRTVRVKAEMHNPDGRLRPGLFARVDLGVAQRENVPMIPEEAILQRADGEVIFTSDAKNHAHRAVIQTGVHRDGMVEVVSGAAPGDWVVVRGQAWLTDGQVVVPRNPDGTLATRRMPPVAEGEPGKAANLP